MTSCRDSLYFLILNLQTSSQDFLFLVFLLLFQIYSSYGLISAMLADLSENLPNRRFFVAGGKVGKVQSLMAKSAKATNQWLYD